jgi:SAM-dependent methyltransferase
VPSTTSATINIPLALRMAISDFPRLFEGQYAQYAEDIPFWLELAAECHGPVLELGCGYGRVMHALAAAGIPTVGIDCDPGMLARAFTHLSEFLDSLVSLHQADIRDFALKRSFPLVISPCNTFAFLSDHDFQRATACVARHLLPGGRLVLDLPLEWTRAANMIGASELCAAFDDLESGNPVQVSSKERFDPDGQQLLVTWLYDELFPDGRVKRTEIPVTYHLRGPEELLRLLLATGYQAIEFFADFLRRPYHRGAGRIVVSARR